MKKHYFIACLWAVLCTNQFVQASSNPMMTRVYGAQYTPEVADTQTAGAIGALDTTFDTDGSISVASVLTGGTAVGIQPLSNGNFIVVVQKSGSSSKAAQYNAEGSLVASSVYGTSGVADLGTSPTPRTTMLDAQGRLVVAGGSAANSGWISRVSADGDTVTALLSGSTVWTYIGDIAQQTTGKIIAVGYDGSNARIARYNLNGTIDTDFGSSGYTILNGSLSVPVVPNVATGLTSVVVDSSNNIYVAFVAAVTVNGFTINNAYIARFTAAGALDTSWNTTGYAALSALNSATSTLYVAKDSNGNFLVGGQVSSSNIVVTGVDSTGAALGGSYPFNTSTAINADTYTISNLITASNNRAFIVGSKTTDPDKMSVIALIASTGLLDNTTNDATTAFTTNGYNFFSISSPDTNATINAAAIGATGQLYTAGYQIDGGTTTPYVSRLNNVQYVSQVAQFPAAQEQGIQDLSFGTTTTETYPGVMTPYNGTYASSLQQRAKAVIEVTTTPGAGAGVPPVGDILIGMDGCTDTTNYSSMMLVWLNSLGAIDTSVGVSGFLTLNNAASNNEYLTSLLQIPGGAVLVGGYSASGFILRSYASFTSPASPTWQINDTANAGVRTIGLGYQSSVGRNLVFLFNPTNALTSQILAYDNNGLLDGGFGQSGVISYNTYTLNMGPCYGGLITTGDELIIAYKNTTDNTVRSAMFTVNANDLNTNWNPTGTTPGISNALFAGSTAVDKDNIRICFNSNTDVLVAAVDNTSAGSGTANVLFTLLDGEHGVVDTTFGTTGVLTVTIPLVTGSTGLVLKQAVGVSDGTVLVTFNDDATDDVMYVARIITIGVGTAGTLDTTFNSQGSQPGILPIQIGDQVTNYAVRAATGILVQSTSGLTPNNQGNIAVVGYESLIADTTDATPMVMRVYGDPGSTEIPYYPIINSGIPGTLDIAYDEYSLLGFGQGNAIFTYPGSNTYQGKVLVGYNTGAKPKIARIDITTNKLDTTFNGSGIYTFSSLADGATINTISIDANNNILVGGGSDTNGMWAQRLTPTASGATSFDCSTIYGALTIGSVVNKILQQKSGRYIVAGSGSITGPTPKGFLAGFKDKLMPSGSGFVLDPTFNPLATATGSATPSPAAGIYYVNSGAYAGINSFALNYDDTIAVVYQASATVLGLTVITADGSGVDSGFNGGAAVTTSVQSDGVSVSYINVDSSKNMYIAASKASSNQFMAAKYIAAGTLDVWGASGVRTITSGLGTAGVTLTNALATSTGQLILVGYNTAGADGKLIEARLNSAGTLDSNWNPTGTVQGILTFNTSLATAPIQLNASAMTISGLVVSTGRTTTDASTSHPILTYVYGDTYVTQQSQAPLEAAAGTLDSTIPGGSTGAAALAGTVTGIPQKIYVYDSTEVNNSPNGAILVGSVSSASVKVTQLNSDLSVNTAFGSTGVVTLTPNSSTTPTSATITDLYVANGTNDTAQPIYVTGYTTDASAVNTTFTAQIKTNGAITSGSDRAVTYLPVSSLVAGSSIQSSGCVRQTTNSRVLVSGYNGTSGVIVAYQSQGLTAANSATAFTALDTSFGNGNGTTPGYGAGYYSTGVANGIYAMAVDNEDRIYIAYKSGSAIAVQRLLGNGTAVDPNFSATFTTAANSYSVTQIKMVIDLTNSQLVVAAQDGTGNGNILQVARFNLNTGASVGSSSAVTVTGSALSLADLFIDNDSESFTSGAYPNIYVVGYISGGTGIGNSVVARLITTSTAITSLDPAYNTAGTPAGIANAAAGSMTVVNAGMLDLDRRVYVVGYNGSNGYIARFFGDQYWIQASPAILQAQVGTVDITLDPTTALTGVAGIDLSTVTNNGAGKNWTGLATYPAFAVLENQNNDGSVFVAFDAGANVVIGKATADMNLVEAFGDSGSTNGLTAALAMSTVNSLAQDVDGNILVVGASGGAQKVYLFNTSGVKQATFAAPTVASTKATAIGQQKSGRYIIAGYDGSANGMIMAYKNSSAITTPGASGSLAVDTTFGPNVDAGYYPTGINAQIDDLVIDQNDYIYYTYRDGSNNVWVGKLTPQGSLATSANSPSAQVWLVSSVETNPINTGMTASASTVTHIAINSAGNLLIGATTSSGVDTVLCPSTTAFGSSAVSTAVSALGSTNTPVLGRLVGAGATANPGAGTEFYGVAYNSATTSGATAFAMTNAGALDSSFGATTGKVALSGVVPSLTNGANGISVQPDGKIVAVGAIVTSSNPYLMRAYAYPFVAQFEQAPEQATCGTLDTTLWPTTGALDLYGYTPVSGTISTLNGSRIQRIYEYTSGSNLGKMLVVADNANSAADTVLMRLNKDFTLDATFSLDGYLVIGASDLPVTHHTNATSLFVDSDANIYVAGGVSPSGTASTSWLYAYSDTGAVKTGWTTPTSNLANGAYQVGVQSNDRTIVVGLGATNAALYGYNTAGVLDNSFGTGGILLFDGNNVNGVATPTSTNPITDFAIDQYDDLITVENNAGTVVLRRVQNSGLTVYTPSASYTALSGAVSGSRIKNCIDSNGYIIVAAATSTGFVVRSYLNNADGTITDNAASAVSITGLNPCVIANLYATSDSKVTLVGYDATSGNIVVARLVSGAGSLALDTTTFNPSTGYVVADIDALDVAYDGFICADDRIMIGGTNSTSNDPYLGRVFGDNYVTYVSQGRTQGVAGTLNTTFGDTNPPTGLYHINTLNSILVGGQGKAIFPVSDGGYYMAIDNANTAANSLLIRTVASGALDVSYNSVAAGAIPGIAGSATSPVYLPLGVNGILQDGSNNVVAVGTTATPAAWIKRYTSAGVADTTFNTNVAAALSTLSTPLAATVALEQTLARLVVAGKNSAGKAALFAFESLAPNAPTVGNPGALDVTFNSTGTVPGQFSISGITGTIYNLIADNYDRLIFAVYNSGTSALDLYRLTPTGEADLTFGSSGIVTGAISSAAADTSARVALDSAGNIIVTATSSTANTFSVNAFDNGTSTTLGANGAVITGWNNGGGQLNIASLTGPTVTSLATSADGYVLVGGTQSGTGAAWIARIKDSSSSWGTSATGKGTLDQAGFNPSGTPAGIFQYSAGGGTTAHVYNGIAVNTDGTLGFVGYENSTGTYTPTVVGVYDDPYTSQESQSPDSHAVGSNDLTLGVSPTSTTNKGITFYGVAGGAANYGQVAEAVALYDDNNIVVAMDGGAVASGASKIFINMFDNDGLLYNQTPAFGTAGRATLSTLPYQNQYVRDMITFTTTTGVRKAILAGYTYNSALPAAAQYSSLLLQYILTPGSNAIDTANFGGYQGSPAGIAFGDGKQLFSVAQQTSGRIIAAGLSQNNLGLLLGYTASGKLDNSFGNNGYQSTNTGSTGIYTHAVDTQNRVLIAYNDGSNNVAVVRFLADGSAPDSGFTVTSNIANVIAAGSNTVNSNMKVAVDNSNNVYAVAGVASNTIAVKSYDQATGNQLNTVGIAGSSIGNASGVFAIARVIVDQSGKVVIVAYDTNSSDQIVVIRLTSALALDNTFNYVDGSTYGYIRYAVAGGTTQVATDAMLHPDGRIVVVGSEN